MPATYTVTTARTQDLAFSSSRDSMSITWKRDYYVDVSGVADETQISAYDVLTATGIPVVNKTVWSDGDGKIIPFVVCSSKTAKQHPQRLSRWTVQTEFKSVGGNNQQRESDNAPIEAPASLTDITPKVVSSLGEMQRVLFQDRSETPKLCWATPAGNSWSEPFIFRVPTLTLKITQYESSITYEQMLQRKFKVNQGMYRSKVRYSWLIEDVEATEVEVTLSGGPVTAALVTYTIAHNPLPYGWKDERALVDTQYRVAAGSNKILQFHNQGKPTIGYITVTGEKRQSQTGLPTYDQWETYDDIDFSGFLLV